MASALLAAVAVPVGMVVETAVVIVLMWDSAPHSATTGSIVEAVWFSIPLLAAGWAARRARRRGYRITPVVLLATPLTLGLALWLLD
ncbi:hypothetical protein ACIRYZ_08785 [Kitasatospora sp. NPDC101155]|uniref:hypothetical protein n=1 Tax=Kitasatospora sp. NPDC101155 TaxID=3364097 RepID=UPI00380BCA34